MRYDATFLVKRLAPMMGRPDSPKRITVVHQAYTLEAAMGFARLQLSPRPWKQCGSCWIERRGQPATQKATS